MQEDETVEYYRGRSLHSIVMAEAATESGIRKIHLELARRYANMADRPKDVVRDNPTSI